MKEASATAATAKSTQAPVPLILERRTKSALEDRQAVPHPGVGDEAEAGANNNQGAGKQKETTSEAVRSPKPCVQPVAKNKGVEQQKETAVPLKVPPIEIKKAEKKQGSKRAKGKGSLVKSMEKVQVPKEVKKPKRKNASAAPNLSKASEQPMKRKLPLQAATVRPPSKRAKVKSSALLKSLDSLLPPKPYLELCIDGKLVRMCRADPACPTQNTKMEKRTRMMDHLRKQHGFNVAIPTRVGGRVGGVSLNLIPKSSMRDQICTQECFWEVDRKYEVNRKAVERRAVIKPLECWDIINKRHLQCNKDDFVQNFVASQMRKADAMQELKKDTIIRKIRQGYECHVQKEEKESDLVEIYDSSDEEEARHDQEEAKDEGEEEESGEEEEKSICEEGEEDEDEGGDEEGADDEKEDGEKAKEEGRESDGEKTDEGDGGIGDDEDSKDDREGSEDDGKGDEEGDCAKSTDKSDEGDVMVLAWMEVMKGTGLVLRGRRPRRHPTRRPHPSQAGVAGHLGQLLLLHQ
ncbi:hypothetical protein L7F22_047492 [Adiantum nelumboides]|nr:hypothetical protein [Adiantum nelumboides]